VDHRFGGWIAEAGRDKMLAGAVPLMVKRRGPKKQCGLIDADSNQDSERDIVVLKLFV
jgi:hypothetical protein